MEQIVLELGFESIIEFNKLVSNVDISTKSKMAKFIAWKDDDGTKQGILQLESIN